MISPSLSSSSSPSNEYEFDQIKFKLKHFSDVKNIIQISIEVGAILLLFILTFFCIDQKNRTPELIFFLVLLIGILSGVTFLTHPFQSDAIFYFWLLWMFWIIYGFGYYSSHLFLESWFIVSIWSLLSTCFYVTSLIFSIDLQRAIGMRLIILFLLVCFVDIIPLRTNNLFELEYDSHPYSRMFCLCILTLLLNFQYRQHKRLGHDLALRFLIQINYTLFAHIIIMIIIFVIHLTVILINDKSFFIFLKTVFKRVYGNLIQRFREKRILSRSDSINSSSSANIPIPLATISIETTHE